VTTRTQKVLTVAMFGTIMLVILSWINGWTQ